MRAQGDIDNVARELLSTHDLNLVSSKTLQSLWAGYGHICHIVANGADGSRQSLILKYVTPPLTDSEARPNEGHLRKVLSYQVEQYFYTSLAPLMPKSIGVASCLVGITSSAFSNSSSSSTAMIMSDLRTRYPVAGEKRSELDQTQVHAALDWLASFHGFWWSKTKDLKREHLVRPPLEHFDAHQTSSLVQGGVWLNGGYTYLATRRSEYSSLESDAASEWSESLCKPTAPDGYSVAELAALLLSPSLDDQKTSSISDHMTLIHGDVKSENLFTTTDGKSVAFFDFQYIGLGLGVCDLAKLLTCSVPLRMLVAQEHSPEEITLEGGEEEILRLYLNSLQTASGRKYEWDVFLRHWETALIDWLRFQASWGFWGNTEWLEGRVRSILTQGEWLRWAEESLA